MVFKAKSIIAVGAHPDDIELGCGGTLCQAVKKGVLVTAVYMTKGEQSGEANVRIKESKRALEILGVKHVHFGNFKDTEVPCSHDAINFLEEFVMANKPDIALTHTTNDTHQDHRQVGWLSISAFRNIQKVLAYETPRVSSAFSPNYFVDITDCVQDKWDALKCHMSQKTKRYIASFRGSQANLRAAEAYEVVKYVET